jgi:hypothetical protein
MEYTSTEISALVLIIVIWIGTFFAGFVLGKLRGAKDLDMIGGHLWLMKGKRMKIDDKLEDIEKAIEAIQRGSE